MAYNDNLPTGEQKNRTAEKMRENFLWLTNYVAYDHTALAGAGTHVKLTMPNNAVNPVTVDGELAIKANVDAITHLTELFMTRDTDAQVPITGRAGNWMRLPSGIILKFGIDTIYSVGMGPGTQDIVYTGPAFAVVFTAGATLFRAGDADENRSIRIKDYSDPTKLEMRVYFRYPPYDAVPQIAAPVLWYAIGR